jgi:hypothetical protein
MVRSSPESQVGAVLEGIATADNRDYPAILRWDSNHGTRGKHGKENMEERETAEAVC